MQQQLGHSKFEFTLRYYTHVTAKMADQAMDLLESELQLPLAQGGGTQQILCKEGILVPDADMDEVCIRYPNNTFSATLPRGTHMEVWVNGSWILSQLDRKSSKWVLKGMKSLSIYGLRTRLVQDQDTVPGSR